MTDISHYQIGDTITISALFYNTANALTDVCLPTFIILNPAGNSASYVYGTDANVIRVATGSFYATAYVPTGSARAAGSWQYTVVSTSGVKQSFQGRWIVDKSPLWTA